MTQQHNCKIALKSWNWRRIDQVLLRSLNELTNESTVFRNPVLFCFNIPLCISPQRKIPTAVISKICSYSNAAKMHTKGSFQRKLRPMLLYIIRKLFSRRWTAKYLNFSFLKGHFTIYIKPLQRSCPSPVTFACKCNNPSANCVRGQ